MQVLGEEGVRRWAMRAHTTLQGFLQEVRVLGVKSWHWSHHCHLSSHPPSQQHCRGVTSMPSPRPTPPSPLTRLLQKPLDWPPVFIPASLPCVFSRAARVLPRPSPSEGSPMAPSSLRRKPGFRQWPPAYSSLWARLLVLIPLLSQLQHYWPPCCLLG